MINDFFLRFRARAPEDLSTIEVIFIIIIFIIIISLLLWMLQGDENMISLLALAETAIQSLAYHTSLQLVEGCVQLASFM